MVLILAVEEDQAQLADCNWLWGSASSSVAQSRMVVHLDEGGVPYSLLNMVIEGGVHLVEVGRGLQ